MKQAVSSSFQRLIKDYALVLCRETEVSKADCHALLRHRHLLPTHQRRIFNGVYEDASSNYGLLPSQKQMATSLFNKCHKELKTKGDICMKVSLTCLITDGWSNIKNKSVINCMVVSPNSCLYLEALLTAQQGHDHKFIANDVEGVFKTYESTTFVGAKMDNTSANKKTWTMLFKKLQLFVKDIFSATKTKKASNDTTTYLVNYPFENMMLFINKCKDIECTKVKKTITDSKKFDLLKKSIEILASLDILIFKYRSHKVPISDVMPDFHALPLEFSKLLAFNIINKYKLAYLIKTCVLRLMLMYSNAHGLAYMLDPWFIAERMLRLNREALKDNMFSDNESRESFDEARVQIIFKRYTEFVITATKAKEEESMRYTMLSKSHKTVLQYWLIDGKYWTELRSVAIKLFSMETCSAALEQNWSTIKFIHLKLRNFLTPKSINELTYIKSNLSIFYD
ncbi:hypothetical protein MPTK2_1g20170 [Marchantia polymorpha subsp. ruderalis]